MCLGSQIVNSPNFVPTAPTFWFENSGVENVVILVEDSVDKGGSGTDCSYLSEKRGEAVDEWQVTQEERAQGESWIEMTCSNSAAYLENKMWSNFPTAWVSCLQYMAANIFLM